MSSSKIESKSKLQEEIANKIGLMLDKPISPKSTKQILDLISNASSPKERVFYMVQAKHRGQLILHMLQTYPYLVTQTQTISSTLATLQKDIMTYDMQMARQLWKAVIHIIYTRQMSANQNQELIYRVGYQELLKEGLKVTNLQKKNTLFGLIQSNVELFHWLGLKGNLRKVILTYVECFRKFPITVPNYVRVLSQLISLIRQSNEPTDAIKPQQDSSLEMIPSEKGIKLQKLPEINDEFMTQMLDQLNKILQSTKQKPLHLLHNQCLIAMEKLISYKGNRILKNDMIYAINKTLDIYLYRKGTRDEARKVALSIQKVQEYLELANRQKMARQYSQSSASQKINQNPVLIENVIAKTNQFLAKYHVNNIGGNGNSKMEQSELFLKNSRFLKRGDGVGGGKAALEVKAGGNELGSQKGISMAGKKKDKYELMLENCLSRGDWRKSEQNPYQKDRHEQISKVALNIKQPIEHNKRQPKHQPPKLSQNPVYQPPAFQQSIYSQFYEQAPVYNQINQTKDYYHQTADISQEQIDQINDLIDLAYSYKFSLN